MQVGVETNLRKKKKKTTSSSLVIKTFFLFAQQCPLDYQGPTTSTRRLLSVPGRPSGVTSESTKGSNYFLVSFQTLKTSLTRPVLGEDSELTVRSPLCSTILFNSVRSFPRLVTHTHTRVCEHTHTPSYTHTRVTTRRSEYLLIFRGGNGQVNELTNKEKPHLSPRSVRTEYLRQYKDCH